MAITSFGLHGVNLYGKSRKNMAAQINGAGVLSYAQLGMQNLYTKYFLWITKKYIISCMSVGVEHQSV